jgi:hypothetical protein
MADVRINGKRFPALQTLSSLGALLTRLDSLGSSNESCLTALYVNGTFIDTDSSDNLTIRLSEDDTVDARMETVSQMAYECIQVAREMAELLVFDIKVATLQLWDNTKLQERSLEVLLLDCQKFLSLGSRPLDLLNKNPLGMTEKAQSCLKSLDTIAQCIEDATFLAVTGEKKDACRVLVARVKPSIESWLDSSLIFAEELELDRTDTSVYLNENVSAGSVPVV